MPAGGRSRFDPFRLRGVLVLTAAYGLVHVLIRLIAGVNLAMDDPKENVFTQKFQLGYLPENPPLYEWLLTLVQQATGPNIFSFLILKYALLCVSAGFFFLAVRRIMGDGKWAAIATLSALSLYQIGWNYHQAFTHSLALIAACCFALWALVRLLQERRWKDYLLFGLAVGLGMLSKYNFVGFLVPVVIAALLDRRTRGALLDRRLAVSALIAVILFLPHGFHLVSDLAFAREVAERKLGLEGGYFSRLGEGLGSALGAVLSFFLPFLLIVGLLARGVFSRRALSEGPWVAIMRRSLLVAIAMIVAGIVLFGVANVTERYVVPFLLPGFVWLIARVRGALPEKGERRWIGAMVGLVVLMALLRIVNVGWGAPPVCDDCHRWIPFAALKEAVVENGLDPQGIYIANEEDTAGNLRRLLPQADIRSINLLFFNPMTGSVTQPASRECYFVWSEELLRAPVRADFHYISKSDSTLIVNAPWRHPFRRTGYRHTEWGISPVPVDTPFYRDFCTSVKWR